MKIEYDESDTTIATFGKAATGDPKTDPDAKFAEEFLKAIAAGIVEVLPVEKEHDKLHLYDKVWPTAPTEMFGRDDDWASMEIEDPGLLENIYGVVEENDHNEYSINWMDGRTGERAKECCMKCAWFRREELTTDRSKFLKVYTDWKSRFDPSKYSKVGY